MINYSQSWEDPEVLRAALNVTPEDTVISITSGGDNSLFLLSLGPKKLYSIDLNPQQNHLLELKIASILTLPQKEIISFLSGNKKIDRQKIYQDIRKSLSIPARQWWDQHIIDIKKGVIHRGKLEKYINVFRKFVLPLIHSPKKVMRFLNQNSLEKQRIYYLENWNSLRWKLLLRIVTSHFIVKKFARQKGMYQYASEKENTYIKRINNNFYNIPITKNYFMRYCLTGRYKNILPPYLQEKTQSSIVAHQKNLVIISKNLYLFLKDMPDKSISKYYLSDIFESMSKQDNDKLWSEIIRTAKPYAQVAYWNNLVYRSFPEKYADQVKDEIDLANNLFLTDRTFFYSRFHLNSIIKK